MSFFKKLRKYKKAGMELSINAIVILIIAMIVLGLGVVFVRGLFVKAGGKLGGAITGAQVAKPASPDEPITVDPTQLEFSVRGDKTKTVVVSVFNTESDDTISLTANCDTTVSGGERAITLLGPDQTIKQNKVGNWNAAITVDTGTLVSGSSAVCTIQAEGVTFSASTSVVISVVD